MTKLFGYIAVCVITVFMLYGCYWVIKTVSYKVFYSEMVRSTITEMVKPESLREKLDD